MRGICPVGLEDGSGYFAGFRLKPSRLSEIQYFLTVGSAAFKSGMSTSLTVKQIS